MHRRWRWPHCRLGTICVLLAGSMKGSHLRFAPVSRILIWASIRPGVLEAASSLSCSPSRMSANVAMETTRPAESVGEALYWCW